MSNAYRTHNTAQISEADAGKTVTVAGWVDVIRDHGGVKFVDIRDHYGIVQVAVRDTAAEADAHYSKECTLSVTGTVVKRDSDTYNDKIATGTVEIVPEKITLLGKVYDSLPFEVNGDTEAGEESRFKYRFLDLRGKRAHDNIVLRSNVFAYARELMNAAGFLEMQTPILSASSPEGARDYLIPSRHHKGRFYALPQAPQIWKQLLMTAGFDRYFQLAPCFRDEDARADRTPGEFYQLDLEMAFAGQEDVFAVAEAVIPKLITKFMKPGQSLSQTPFPRITYRDAMLKYGSDKPDLRNPLIIVDLSAEFAASDFKPFAGKTVRGIRVPNMAEKSKTFFKSMEEYALSVGMKGLGYVEVQPDGSFKGPIDKFLTDEQRAGIKAKNALTVGALTVGALTAGDVLYFIADSETAANRYAGLIRAEVASRMELIKTDEIQICWIVDFPMYESGENGKIEFGHNPFSMPQLDLDTTPPLDILAYQYDMVINGVEIASGAVRNHDPDTMVKAFGIAGLSEDVVREKFGALYTAFRFGAPPHAGMAFGLDRLVMILAGTDNIRDVIAFPLNGNAQDLLVGSPSGVSELQLREAHIIVRK
ncbi:aspartate--tRNA(Asp/Asn) ligase [Clostridia bacterium]|nr:aspartate--tRNA(Asp/Asn) ligase [Clostridia bacterium]